VDYLNGGFSKELLQKVVKALGVRPKEILWIKDDAFKSLNLNIENDDEAVIGRPPEKILTLF
jgi:arsenate reductase-like glutaredoxin family protein